VPTLAELSDTARLRLVPAHPALSDEHGAALLAALDKLCAQFAHEDRLTRWAVELLGDGAVVAFAYEAADVLSGCSHDKLAQILALHEERSGSHLLAAPPIVVEIAGQPRCTDRAGLRAAVADGSVTLDSVHWDVRLDTLGAWRAHGRLPARDTWLSALIQRPRQPAA
jgi:hypothetical protein